MRGRRPSRIAQHRGVQRPRWPFVPNVDSIQWMGLQNWWPFCGLDAGNKSSLYDIVGGKHGTLTNSPVWGVNSDDGGHTLSFDNTNDYVDLGGSNTFVTANQPYAISWWEYVKASSGSFPTRFQLNLGGEGANRAFVVIRSSFGGLERIYWGRGSQSSETGNRSLAAPTLASSVGVWRHYLLTGSNPSGMGGTNGSLYVDGVLYATVATTTTFGNNPQGRNSIGASNIAGASAANCEMFDVRIYALPRPLTAAEAWQFYDPITRWELYYSLGVRTWHFPARNALTNLLTLCLSGHDVAATSATLFINGHEVVSSVIPLLIYGQEADDTATDLFLCGHEPNDDGVTLCVNGYGVEDQDCSLFLCGQESVTGSCTLYACGHGVETKDCTLFVCGQDEASRWCSLYVHGHQLSSGNCDLYLNCHDVSDLQCTLHMSGHEVYTNNIPLCVVGHEQTNEDCTLFIQTSVSDTGAIPLCLNGHQPDSSGTSLYIGSALFATRGMNLVVIGDSLGMGSGNTSLYVQGNTVGATGLFNTSPLYLEAALGNRPCSGMNLTLMGSTVGQTVRYMNLVIEGSAYTADNSAPLVLFNSQTGATNSAPLVIEGEGETDGALPHQSSMILFIQRGEAGACSLFLLGPGQPDASATSLVVCGGVPVTGAASLAIPSAIGGDDKTAGLYTHGF